MTLKGKKLAFTLVGIILLNLMVFSQNKESEETKVDKKGFYPPFVYFGASVGASAYVDLNLAFGSQLTERINIGLSGKYQYYSLGGSVETGFSSHVFGGGVYLQFAVIKDFRNLIKMKTHNGIFLHTEFEMLSLESSYFNSNPTSNINGRFWLQNVLFGPGYINRFNRSSVFALLLWNINNSKENPYDYPQFKVGFTIGF